jgi:uncharacterized Fe-S cluster protein YjdI
MNRKITKKYRNDDVTVLWQPHLCSHSARCFRGLPDVFDPRKRPWITMEEGATEAIVAQVEDCPSKALTYQLNSK